MDQVEVRSGEQEFIQQVNEALRSSLEAVVGPEPYHYRGYQIRWSGWFQVFYPSAVWSYWTAWQEGGISTALDPDSLKRYGMHPGIIVAGACSDKIWIVPDGETMDVSGGLSELATRRGPLLAKLVADSFERLWKFIYQIEEKKAAEVVMEEPK